MCGPTLVIKRDQQPGEHIYCRNCGGEFSLEEENYQLIARPTGRTGTAADLQADIDHELIRKVVAEAVNNMPLEQMLLAQGIGWHQDAGHPDPHPQGQAPK